ncbi:uncharacterized protein FFB20_05719 [Fusarium fujikuroi]|nr:uncharacterized protein FFB20_05719 [Fusarium fujikuroi]
MDYTEFCPKTGRGHNELRTELKALGEASFCPFCRQPLIEAVEVVDLTASSPPGPSSMTIQTERTRPIPITYTNAINMATESQATFYIASGYLEEVIPGISMPKYDKGVKSKNIKSKITAPLGSTFSSHDEMVHFIVSSCHKEFSSTKWKLISGYITGTHSNGPIMYGDAVYKTLRLKDFFEAASITLPVRAEAPVSLMLLYFNVRDNSEDSDTPRPNKRAIEQAETEIPASKRTTKIKREIKNKKEPVRDKRKENDIKAEIKVEVKAKKIKGEEERQHEDLDAFEAFLQSTTSDEDQGGKEDKEEQDQEKAKGRPSRSKALPRRFKE